MREQKTILFYMRPVALTVVLLALGGLGYLAFLAFVKGVLAPQQFASYGLIFTTVGAATASFFSPCSFTVLPSYIAFAGPAAEASRGQRLRHALRNGLVAALGVVTAVGILGVLVGALGTGIGPELSITGEDPNPGSRALRITVGAAVFSLGLLHLMDLSHRIPLLGRISAWTIRAEGEGSSSLRSVYAYGVGYVLVGIGWVGPFLAAVAAFALSTGGFISAFLAFLLFATTMAALMLLISLLVGTSQNTLLRGMRASSRSIQRVSSVVLILVGAGLVYFTIDSGAFQNLFFPS